MFAIKLTYSILRGSEMTSNQKRFIEKIAEVLDYELPPNYEKWTNKQASDFISENIDDFNYYMKR